MADESGRPQLVLMPSGRRGHVDPGANLLEAARGLGVEIESICGGRQTCGKCQVIVETGRFDKHAIDSDESHLSPPEETERAYLSEHGIPGRRLACAAKVLDDVLITVPEESQARKQVIAKAATDRAIEVDPAVRQVYVEVPSAHVDDTRGDWQRLQAALAEAWKLTGLTIDPEALRGLQRTLRKGRWAVTVTLWKDQVVQRVEPGYAEGVHGLAVDIGTTTVVAHLCDLRTGAVLATESMMNPQVRYGEDLMSRVSYGMSEPQGVERMHRAIVRAVNELAEKATAARRARRRRRSWMPCWWATPSCTTCCWGSIRSSWAARPSLWPPRIRWIARRASWGWTFTRPAACTCCRASPGTSAPITWRCCWPNRRTCRTSRCW